MQVVILEDELLISEKLKIIIEGSGHEVVGQFDNAEELLGFEKSFDLAFVDINLSGDLDGVDFVNRYALKSENFKFVFISDVDDQKSINRATSSKPLAYLSKPFKKKDIEIALKLANNEVVVRESNVSNTTSLTTFLKDGDRLISVDLEDLLYIEGQGAYSNVVTSKCEHTVSQNLGSLEQKVESNYIIRVHRSFIVNLTKIDELKNRNSILIGDKEVPIGDSFKEKLFSNLNIL